MRLAVILNGISRRKKFFYSHIVPALADHEVEILETKNVHDTAEFAARAAGNSVDAIFAAGGDGTLYHTVNGLLRGNETNPNLPAIGIIPLGTGNDFARAWGIRADPIQVRYALNVWNPVEIDVGKILCMNEGQPGVAYFINIADIGMGPEVVRFMSKRRGLFGWGSSYYAAILRNFFTFRPFPVTIETDAETVHKKVRTFALANGKYFGRGLCIAPASRSDDGFLETFTVGNVSVWDFIRHTGSLKRGKQIQHPNVRYGQTKVAKLSATIPALLQADGELVGSLPATVSLLEKRLKFFAPI